MIMLKDFFGSLFVCYDRHMKNSRTQGSVTVVIIVILTVAIIGSLGYVAWNSFRNEKTISATPSETKASTRKLTEDVPVENKVIIEELGISVVVPDSIKDLTYTYTPNGQPTKVNGKNIVVGSVKFSTESLMSKYPECSPEEGSPLGALTKVTGIHTDDVLGPTWSGGGLKKQFSDNFITFVGPQYACFATQGDGSGMGVRISSLMNDLSISLENAVEL